MMNNLIYEYKDLAIWLTSSSAVLLLLSLIIVPFILVRIPSDYFSTVRSAKRLVLRDPNIFLILLVILKNILGVVLLLCGIAMLVLPGQGILTILLSITLLDFPGKHRLERWLVSRPSILKSINYLRKRANKPSLRID